MIKGFILIITLAFSTSALYAAESNTTKSDLNKSAKKAVSSNEAAYALLKEMQLKKVYDNAVEGSTQRLVAANSSFKGIESKIKDFYKKYIGWESVKKDLAKLYSKYYTTDELMDITNFYKTKTGQKVLATMSKLSYEGQVLTQSRLRPHMQELKKILDDAVAKSKESKAKVAPTKDVTKKEEPKK